MLTHLNYNNFDEDYLVNLFLSNQNELITYTSTADRYQKVNDDWKNGWKILKMNHPYFDIMMKDLNIEAEPRFYILEPNTYLPTHKDNGTLCSVNFILKSDNPAPITIEGIEYKYKRALIDVSKNHSVKNGSESRILLKFSIKSKTYEEVLKEIKYIKS